MRSTPHHPTIATNAARPDRGTSPGWGTACSPPHGRPSKTERCAPGGAQPAERWRRTVRSCGWRESGHQGSAIALCRVLYQFVEGQMQRRGHGIGRTMHEAPSVPNEGGPVRGMTLTSSTPSPLPSTGLSFSPHPDRLPHQDVGLPTHPSDAEQNDAQRPSGGARGGVHAARGNRR